MYKIDDEHKLKAEDHYSQYKENVLKAIEDFLKNVPKDSYAYAFLNRAIKNEGRLRVLLMGDFQEQKLLINEVDDELAVFELRKSGVSAHFRPLMKKLFVKGIYDNADIFSKADHVKRVGIEICPYCGRSYIYYAEHPTTSNPNTIVKPEIDHFLPKDKYPYLALNYYNLIPSCHGCNFKPCKYTNDPIGDARDKEYLMHPYEFKDERIEFSYKPTTKLYDKQYIEVRMKCDSTDLDEGYKNWLNLDQFYAKHNGIVKNMYVMLNSLQESYQSYTGKNFSIPAAFIEKLPEIIFGYRLSPERAKEELMYKFKKDIYMQMREQLYDV